MPSGSLEPDASKATARFVGVEVNAATGAWFAAATVTVWLTAVVGADVLAGGILDEVAVRTTTMGTVVGVPVRFTDGDSFGYRDADALAHRDPFAKRIANRDASGNSSTATIAQRFDSTYSTCY